MAKTLVWVGVLLCALALHPAAAPAQENTTVGTVVAQRGVVTAIRETGAVALHVGAAIRASDRVITAAGGRARIELADNSTLTLGENTTIDIENFTASPDRSRLAAVVSLLQGIMRAVATTARADTRFDIVTPAAIASVRSTDWIVDVGESGTAVFVFSGRVAVSGRAGPGEVVLEPGFGTSVRDGPVKTPTRWGEARVAAIGARTDLR